MPHRRLFFIQACTLVVLAVLHTTALNLSLYWLFPWLDTGVHFLGGLWAMLFAHYIFLRVGIAITPTRMFVLLACVALGWELFELWGGIPREANFAFDTTVDLIMDGLGGISGYLLAKRLIARDRITHHDATQEDTSKPSSSAA
jgi:hypothetical protein